MRYSAYGLNIASELPLPELRPGPEQSPDVSIRYGHVPASAMAGAEERGVTWQAAPGRLLIEMDDIARYLVVDGREIVIERCAGSADEDVRIFLLGSALAALLHQRRILALHASAVRAEHGAVLFMGQSGSGKSTLLASLVRRGFPMLADDVSAVTLDEEGRPIAQPGFPTTRLWADAAEHLRHPVENLRRVRASLEKYHLPIDRFCAEPAPLRAAYVLTSHNQHDIRFEPVAGVARFSLWTRYTYRSKFLHGLDLRRTHFDTVGALAARVPMTLIARPDRLFLLDELVSRVAEEIG
jgi:hypothetical protein